MSPCLGALRPPRCGRCCASSRWSSRRPPAPAPAGAQTAPPPGLALPGQGLDPRRRRHREGPRRLQRARGPAPGQHPEDHDGARGRREAHSRRHLHGRDHRRRPGGHAHRHGGRPAVAPRRRAALPHDGVGQRRRLRPGRSGLRQRRRLRRRHERRRRPLRHGRQPLRRPGRFRRRRGLQRGQPGQRLRPGHRRPQLPGRPGAHRHRGLAGVPLRRARRPAPRPLQPQQAARPLSRRHRPQDRLHEPGRQHLRRDGDSGWKAR